MAAGVKEGANGSRDDKEERESDRTTGIVVHEVSKEPDKSPEEKCSGGVETKGAITGGGLCKGSKFGGGKWISNC